MTTPLIAVPTARVEPGAVRDWRPGAFAVAETYIEALRRAGARPMLVPPLEPAPADEILAPFDGVLHNGAPNVHRVRIQPGSRLAAAGGTGPVDVVARHHQAVDRLGAGLTATAWAEDGTIEAIELSTGWLVGVQWHPEVTAATDPTQQALFDVLVDEAAKHRLARVA